MNQDLINRAQELRNHGFTTGEIADDLLTLQLTGTV